MHSELHERLEYLVNYSSQLIFVSGDSIAQQQRTLEAFVFQQHDDTEIAYVTAEPEMELSDYRRQLCRQLLGQVVGSYVRPLNELLSSLNQHEGPILITLTQAQHMPDRLLQELWDLVLQSRFAGNKQHLNVLLFGETQWAENAKQWLPAKNTDTPLLISSQSVHTEPESSDLDKLIARRREDFQQHMARRYGQSQQSFTPRLKSPWFLAAVVVVFLSLFGSLIAWQYGNDISSLFGPLKSEPATVSNDTVAPGSAFDKIAAPQIDATSIPAENTSPDNTEISGPGNDNSGLVTQWKDAVDALPRVKSNVSETSKRLPENTEQEAPVNVASSAKPDTVADNPVTVSQDVISDTPPQSQTKAVTQSETVTTDTVTTESPASDNTDIKNVASDAPEQIVADNDLVASLVRQDDFMLQLAGMKDNALLARFVSDNNLTALTHVYRTQRYGGDWYVLLFHQPFSSLQDARQALASLPDYQGRENAFVKRGNQILNELRVATSI
ncbi:SPOR domain-containing protein [Alteromonas antoniana]|uniref:SPOR domain-containing protein n=1 Tax=Alteromonas antoniana TaxID=2803813 RepID=UPI001C4538EA